MSWKEHIPDESDWPCCPTCGVRVSDVAWFGDFGQILYENERTNVEDGDLIGLICDECGEDFLVEAEVTVSFKTRVEE